MKPEWKNNTYFAYNTTTVIFWGKLDSKKSFVVGNCSLLQIVMGQYGKMKIREADNFKRKDREHRIEKLLKEETNVSTCLQKYIHKKKGSWNL